MTTPVIDDIRFKQLVLDNPAFGRWFWMSTDEKCNGDQIIEYINTYATQKNRLRREELGPYIYGIVVNSPKIEIEVLGGSSTKTMKLMKVGFTMSDTDSTNKHNRVATVMAEVQRKLKKKHQIDASCSPIFVLPINGTVTRGYTDVEKEIRTKCGIDVPQKVCEALNLPVTTEWVVTTDQFTWNIRKKIKEIKFAKYKSGRKSVGGLEKGLESMSLQDTSPAASTGKVERKVDASPAASTGKAERKVDASPATSKGKAKGKVDASTAVVHDTETVFGELTFDAELRSKAELQEVKNTLDTIEKQKYGAEGVNVSLQEDSRTFKLLRNELKRSQ